MVTVAVLCLGVTGPLGPQSSARASGGAGDPAGASAVVTPAMALTPTRDVVSGATLSVTGRGFAPDSTALVRQCADPADTATCDDKTFVVVTTDAAGDFAVSVIVKRGKVGQTGRCGSGSTCFVAATTDTIEGDPAYGADATFTFVAARATTSTQARYATRRDRIVGRVTSDGHGIAGARVRILRRVDGTWKGVNGIVATRQGWFASKVIVRPGRYRARTSQSAGYRSSLSTVVRIR